MGIRKQRNGQMFPGNHIFTHRVSPVHGTPDIGLWVVLVEQMIFTFVIDHAIRIIHPHRIGGKMILWSVFFVNPDHIMVSSIRCTHPKKVYC